MKNQKGFTLIELLLVLAIIGIISAIAIPALLAQRSRARDKSSQQNATSIVADLVAALDKAKEDGTPVATLANVNANIIGTAAASAVPQVYQARNPWSTPTFESAYAQAAILEADTLGTATKGAATLAKKGQVQIGFLPPNPAATPPVPGAIVTAVYLQNTYKDAANVDQHVFFKVSNIE
jgi:prepilin-type N-terminal cleavage/methylation domain-containing protein